MITFIRDLFIPNYNNSFYPNLLRKPALILYTILIVSVNAFFSIQGVETYASDVSSTALVDYVNQERRSTGLSELKVNSRLVSAAYAKADHIFENQYWSHYGPDGEAPWDFIDESGYDYIFAGENLAKGFDSSEGVHSAWMASKTHRENILNSNYREIGIAVVPGKLMGDDVILVVQMFGTLDKDGVPEQSSRYDLESMSDGSVEIVSPSEGSILSDVNYEVEGISGSDVEKLELLDNGEFVEELICTDGAWIYRPSQQWTEGEHVLGVTAKNSGDSDSVKFKIDTNPPEFIPDTLGIEKVDENKNEIEISVKVIGDPEQVDLFLGNISRNLDYDGEKYSAKLSMLGFEDVDDIRIVALDEAGNHEVLDISDKVLGVTSFDKNWPKKGLVLGISDFSSIFNKLVVLFIAILLLIDGFYLLKLNIFQVRGRTLFPMAVWVIVVGIAFVVGSGGSIV